jgi:hypothetical protein
MKIMPRPVELVAVSVSTLPEWLTRKWTWKRSTALVFLWISIFCLSILHLVSRSLLGTIEGFGDGLVQGVEDTWRDFCRYWEMFEECE